MKIGRGKQDRKRTYITAKANLDTKVGARAPIVRSEGPGRLAAGCEERLVHHSVLVY